MKTWNKPEIEVLSLELTEFGSDHTPWVDEVRQDENDPTKNWYSFSGEVK